MELNIRFLEVFRDMQRLKMFAMYCAKSDDPKISQLAQEALAETKSTYEWQHKFKAERGLDWDAQT
jgi:hypothetical protein